MEADRPAPPVVVVVVTSEPGNWFEETLTSLAGQDYSNLSVLVIDAASPDDPTARVAAVLPRAFVRRLDTRVPFGRAANEVLGIVEGASHFLLCHDDVVLAPDAVRLLVEQAFRSNAGIACPKLVEWEQPDRLLAVGMAADKSGFVHPLTERGELDQEQHDSVRDVFVAPGAATLVRADLFATLGGFDPDVAELGEDLDLCWRAHIAGARVIVAPAARVRHLEATQRGLRAGTDAPGHADRATATGDEHRIRTLLDCYGLVTLAWVLPLVVAYTLGYAVVSLLGGHPGRAADRVANLGRVVRRPSALRRSRRRAQSHRRVPDRRVRRLQSRGNAPLRAWVRARLEGPSSGLPFAEPGTLGTGDDEDDLLTMRRRRRPDAGRPARTARRRPDVRTSRPVVTGSPSTGTDDPRADDPRTDDPRTDDRETDDLSAAPVAATGRRVTDGVGESPDDVAADGPVVAGAAPGEGGAGPGADGALPVAAGFGVPDVASIGRGGWRTPLIAAATLVVLLAVGSRSLLGQEIPGIGQIPVTSGGIGSFWRAWWSTWQPAGLGRTGPSAPALALLGLAGSVLFGAVGTLQHVLVLGPLVVGPLGVYRAARWWGSQRGRVAALIAYALLPLPYNAMAHGRWDGLLAYAAAPWLLGMLGRLSDSLPYPATRLGRIVPRVLVVAVLTAIVGAFVPSWLLVVPVVAVALALGSLVVAQAPTALRFVVVGVGGAVAAWILLLPWSARVFTSRVAVFGVPAGPSGRLSIASLLRMHTGAIGSGPLAWGLLVAAALPLVLGRSWRLAWAARLWLVVAVCVAWAWMGLRGWVPMASPEVVLAPAGAALAGSVGLGVVAFELDLPGYRFGWRQGASAVAALGLLLGILPVVGGAGSGRWNLPSAGSTSVLARIETAPGGDYRILWVGAPSAIPTASSPLGGGLAWATTFDGAPDVAGTWSDGPPGGTAAFVADIRLAEQGRTTQLGHLLAPLGVRYLVLPSQNAPSGSGGVVTTAPTTLASGLLLQTDLAQVDLDADYTVYQNAAWLPVRAVLSPAAAAAASGPSSGAAGLRNLEATDLAGSAPVLVGGHANRVTGPVPAGATVFVSADRSGAWTLRVGGRVVHPQPAFGDGLRFTVPATASGRATLAASSSVTDRVLQLLLVAVWAAVIAVVALDRRRRVRSGTPDETVRPEWFTPLSTGRRRSGRTRAVSNAPVGMDSDEVWIDA